MINTIVFNVMVLVYDWRAGLLVVAGTFVYLLIVSKMEKKIQGVGAEAAGIRGETCRSRLRAGTGNECDQVL